MTLVLKEFIRKLKTYLKDRTSDYTYTVHGEGGCETCGYGAPVYHDLDIAALETEIDKFAAEFEKS